LLSQQNLCEVQCARFWVRSAMLSAEHRKFGRAEARPSKLPLMHQNFSAVQGHCIPEKLFAIRCRFDLNPQPSTQFVVTCHSLCTISPLLRLTASPFPPFLAPCHLSPVPCLNCSINSEPQKGDNGANLPCKVANITSRAMPLGIATG
jgi:hypothetical protein